MFAGKDHVNPRRGGRCGGAVAAGGHHRPAERRSTWPRSTSRSPGTSPCGAGEPGFAAPGEGWRLTEAGETAIGGKLPVNPSGGVLSSNPIGASGLLRFAESALQVMGKAGCPPGAWRADRPGPSAYGGGSQFFSMWVVSSTLG